MEGTILRPVIEPPDGHPNPVSGERIPVTIIIDGGAYPWHRPWEGWTITEVTKEVEVE